MKILLPEPLTSKLRIAWAWLRLHEIATLWPQSHIRPNPQPAQSGSQVPSKITAAARGALARRLDALNPPDRSPRLAAPFSSIERPLWHLAAWARN
jgi:hypothetical protein